jgi:hypothetical protein
MPEDSEIARRTANGIRLLLVNTRLRWELTELVTNDGHIARGAFTGTVRALPQPNELKMLEEAFLGSSSLVTGADVIRYFSPSIIATARKYASDSQAETLLSEEGRRGMLAALLDSAAAVAFGCGMEILQPAQIDLDCPTLKRQQIEELDRQAAQRRTADQFDSLRRSAELFGQFQAIRACAPELSPGQVLSRIGVTNQAEVFRALVLASVEKSAKSQLWAVAGPHLIRIDGTESVRAELIDVPQDLGPLRSVNAASDGRLLLGCRAGVLVLDPQSPAEGIRYRDPETTSQLGFNAAVLIAGQLWAAHGEAGLVCWKAEQSEKPAITTRPQSAPIQGFAPRNLIVTGTGQLALSSGRQLMVPTSDGQLRGPISQPCDSEVIAIFTKANGILSAHQDGQVYAWTDELRYVWQSRRAGRLSAAAALPWLGDIRLLLATEDGPICCLGPDDELTTQYCSTYGGLRIIAATADIVAAVTADRQRLILWHSWDGRKPYADLHLYSLAKHRIADIAFV